MVPLLYRLSEKKSNSSQLVQWCNAHAVRFFTDHAVWIGSEKLQQLWGKPELGTELSKT